MVSLDIGKIMREYTGGWSYNELAKKYNTTPLRIKRALLSGGIMGNKSNNHPKKFTDEVKKEICNKYLETQISVRQLAKDYKTSPITITVILLENDIKITKFKRVSQEVLLGIVNGYNHGLSTDTLSKKYDLTVHYIRKVLKQHDVVLHKGKLRLGNNEAEICKQFKKGVPVTVLAKNYGVGHGLIGSILSRHGIQRPKRKVVSNEDKTVICDLSLKSDKFSYNRIGTLVGRTPSIVKRVIEKHCIPNEWGTMIKEIKRLSTEGENIPSIADKIGIDMKLVKTILGKGGN